MLHLEKLDETKLWHFYRKKILPDYERCSWIQQVYNKAVDASKDVRIKFQNYTLHDKIHILNVLEAMAGILGDQIGNLTACEIELLILAACMHDLGMVYSIKEKEKYLADKQTFREFLRNTYPEYLNCELEICPFDVRQRYLRSLHPFRLRSVLQNNEEWKDVLSRWPREIVPQECVLAVCEAHGQSTEDFLNNKDLEYLPFEDATPLFCALLLRLADLLDFDDTRAPKVLYGNIGNNKKSQGEWDKHQASVGFRYPDSPSTEELPFKAICCDPEVEHAVRDYLDWIDQELNNCRKLRKHCHADWQRNFPFPRAVSRKEIKSTGYKSGDFHLTIEPAKMLELLSGEHLYNRKDVFVRELLQNAIDATLLRSKMDEGFSLKEARIDLWEWKDTQGNSWFRIDDQGIGMTQGMLQRYFLRAGNSYYTSLELEQDMWDHDCDESYQGISRFGIGFLSCFLCGNCAEVSTLYFDPKKNINEATYPQNGQKRKFGLRLRITGLTGHYTLKSQADHHPADAPLSAPDNIGTMSLQSLESDGYRVREPLINAWKKRANIGKRR